MAVKWAMKGAAGMAAIEQDDKEAAARQEANKRMWSFYLKYDLKTGKGEEARVTFVDGDLDKDGALDILYFRRHQVTMNGSYNNFFTCTAEEEPCPVCASGNHPDLVGVMTVIDHREFKSKDGTKVYKDNPRLFIAKKSTLKILHNMAVKRGGLAGCTFDISRTGEMESAVGNVFDFIEKNPVEELRKKYVTKDSEGHKVELFVPANYEEEIPYQTADELRALGFSGGKVQNADKGSYSDTPEYEGKF